MKPLLLALALALAVLLPVSEARAQQPDATSHDPLAAAPASLYAAQQQPVGGGVERTVKRFGMGFQGGVGLDPELVDFGVHAHIARVFRDNISFRPGIEIGLGEITTLLNFNLDVLYTFPGYDTDSPTRWVPYAGTGPAFGLSHQGVSATDVDDPDVTDEDENRFDFSDTDFNFGMNFIFGVKKASGLFVEMKATAWGVSNIRLLVGFNF
jgi:hypothetical protein